MPGDSNPILLYDGVCGLCNRFVQFILKRDKADQFRFAALQSEFARKILERHGVSALDLDTVYLVKDYEQPQELLLSRSDAAIAVGRGLGGWWRVWASVFRIMPRVIRNWGYNAVARSRYQIFGKYDACPLPDSRARHKFLDQSSFVSRP
ncbi:MAG TPA: DCC1-like thiol-disulfide oxidoreductase family protein [Terriglobales bacterium]|nr:DCC1-like thiol-disulfide oxidoreductase family protein [Terriglobales bacterium]